MFDQNSQICNIFDYEVLFLNVASLVVFAVLSKFNLSINKNIFFSSLLLQELRYGGS